MHIPIATSIIFLLIEPNPYFIIEKIIADIEKIAINIRRTINAFFLLIK